MCGIAGIFGPDASESNITKMVDSLEHRGPDGKGIFTDENIALGHTRLSIIDLTQNGKQPMCDNTGKYVIVYNGEVYNFNELKTTFLSEENFESGNDTETLLKLYIKLGVSMLEHLRGMFAFVIFDKEKNEIFGARDRMGVKPFLYSHQNNNFIFASELSAFNKTELIDKQINKKAVRQLFMYGSIQFPNTMYQQVFSLAPGSFFTVKNNEITIKKYWKFPSEESFKGSFEQACSEFSKIFSESIKLRLLSERKVGVFLSAGLDSVSILATLKDLKVKFIETFTIGFKDHHKKFFDEAQKAKAISTYLGYENKSDSIDIKEIKKYLDSYLKTIDQPSIDGFNTFLVSSLSKEHLTVALSGLGGDELMLGYPRNINLFNKHRKVIKIPSFINDFIIKQKIGKGKSHKFLNALINRFGNPSNIKLNYWASRLIMTTHEANLLLNSNTSLDEDLADFFQFDEENYNGSFYSKISYYEMRSFMLSQLLRDMDCESMSQSIEVRFPLIDHKLVEFVFSLPANYKFNLNSKSTNHKTGKGSYKSIGMKHLLVESYKDKLPEGFMDTPKQGFQLPVLEWFMEYYGNNLKSIFDKKLISEFGFNETKINQILDAANKKNYNNTHFLMLMIANWKMNMTDGSTNIIN